MAFEPGMPRSICSEELANDWLRQYADGISTVEEVKQLAPESVKSDLESLANERRWSPDLAEIYVFDMLSALEWYGQGRQLQAAGQKVSREMLQAMWTVVGQRYRDLLATHDGELSSEDLEDLVRNASLAQYLEKDRKAFLRFCGILGWEPGVYAPPAAGQGSSRDLEREEANVDDFDFANPDSLAYKAVLERIRNDPAKILKFGMVIGGNRNRPAGKVGTPSTPHSEMHDKSGSRAPSEYHAKADELGQVAIDWLYSAQLWVQAEAYNKPVTKMVIA